MFLCIDTTTSEAGITLVGESVFREVIDPYQASETILEVIDRLLKKAGATAIGVKGVFVIKGPGSFTGLRVGISVANAFAHELGVSVTGVRTNEWWDARTDEKEFLYLQSMNKAEVYAVDKTGQKIIAVSELLEYGTIKWLGQVSEDHRKQFPEAFGEITVLKSAGEAWKKVVLGSSASVGTTVEPYYGKDPMITKSKRKFSIND